MTIRSQRRNLWAGLIAWIVLMGSPASHAAEKLIWLMRDLPPLTVFEGPQKGRGVIDQLMPFLIANLPQYEHEVVKVNRARALQMLEDTTLACDPALVWNPARARSIVYSTPIMGLHSNGLVIRRSDQARLAPFVSDQTVDLKNMLNAQAIRLGIVAKRSYGVWIDEQLAQGEADAVFIHYGNDALGSLLQMQQAGRIGAILGYWPEIQSKARQQGLSLENLVFYRIHGAPTYQPIYIGCTATPAGREALVSINHALSKIDSQALFDSQTQWQAPDQHDDYLNAQPAPLQPQLPR